ncbi:Peroxisomal adenine nucleotide carrier 1 [Seminavis robusta]|uniref:Peroxisomal adenine nucleotide carrier 1 n=1 Tax=Seminavis robusta TaxID=568900 RepID=A0A9N8HKC4_9STRA|nr:Peroxisomal adenine nucleotide carrier 1 [Seminavis robusta]|eukprot:Sro720_g192590.1 Peroxisomal adenine nucleotide carrier 1 (309) ;mRNA; r:21857-22864
MASQQDTIASEVIAASLGGAISASVLYPLEVLKTKMQAEGGNDDKDDDKDDNEDKKPASMVQYASRLYDQEGGSVFFRGVETSAFQSATEKALYFFAYQALKEIHSAVTGSKKLDGLSNIIMGAAAEWAHLPITLPLDCWTTQIQTSTNTDETPMALLCNLLAAGPSKMYKGIQAYTVLCLKPALQYTIFEQVKGAVVAGRVQKTLSAVEAFLLGMMARAVATVVVFPYLRAKVMLQAASQSSTGDSSQKTSIPSMLATMYGQGGVASWFQGLGPELTRGVMSAALMMMIKEKIAIIVKDILKRVVKY